MYGSPKDLNLPFKESDHQPHQMSSGLLRYRSAPSTMLGELCEDFLPVRPSSPETETMFARFLAAPGLHSVIREKPIERTSQFAPPPPPPATTTAAMELRRGGDEGGFTASQMLYHSMDSGGGGNCSNLIRQSSSPAGLFSHLNADNGFGVMRGVGGFRNGNGSMGEGGSPGASRLKGQISFSSRQNSSSQGIMSQISEMGSDEIEGISPEESGNTGGRCFIPGYPTGSWDESSLLADSFSGLKRGREVEGKFVAGLNQSEAQNGELRTSLSGLGSTDMASIEKFLQFQDSVPCKIRAKRGCATHPRSIAERVRRTRISERMRKLQELVPNMDKQTNTADMLDLAVEHINALQRQVKILLENRLSCTCSSSKQKPYSKPEV